MGRTITTARWIPEVKATDVGNGMTELTVDYTPIEEREIQYFQWAKKKARKPKPLAYKAVIILMCILPILMGLSYSVTYLKHDIAYIIWMALWITFDIIVILANRRKRR